MDRTERFYKIEMLIRSRSSVRFDTLLAELEVSPATLKRDLAYLRERLGAPIEWDAFSRGYRFAQVAWRGAPKHELPSACRPCWACRSRPRASCRGASS